MNFFIFLIFIVLFCFSTNYFRYKQDSSTKKNSLVFAIISSIIDLFL